MRTISVDQAAQLIINSHGKIFTVVCWGQKPKNGNFRSWPRDIKDERKRQKDKIEGYLTIKNFHTKKLEKVDTRNIRFLSINKTWYEVTNKETI